MMKKESQFEDGEPKGSKTVIVVVLVLAVIIVIGVKVFTDNKAQSMERTGPVYGDVDAMEKAMAECRETVGLDENGRPDRDAIDTCMTEKGFPKPEGMPGGRGPGRPMAPDNDRNGADVE